jgi:predicted transcriptional regulator of viral defense system
MRRGQGTARGGDATRTAQLGSDVQVLSHDGCMTQVLDRKETALKLVRSKGLLRAKEAAAVGVDRSTLARLCQGGLLERLERGLYGMPAAAVREHIDLEIVARRVPQAVFCLLSALRLHGLGTQQPRRVWICLPRGVHSPTLRFPPLEVVHVQSVLHRLQVETLRSGPIRLKVYGVEKTLVDCFRHRRRLGMEPVLEALKDAINQRRLNVDELWQQAKAQRMQRVMAPYLEALL